MFCLKYLKSAKKVQNESQFSNYVVYAVKNVEFKFLLFSFVPPSNQSRVCILNEFKLKASFLHSSLRIGKHFFMSKCEKRLY